MRRKALVGVAAVGAIFGLRRVLRRVGHQMHQHCDQMMAELGRGHAVGGT